jgi:hypothetical protein
MRKTVNNFGEGGRHDPEWDSMTDKERDRSGVYIKMPRGFHTPGHLLKLKKSLYGLKQSSQNFFLHLKEKLEECGLEQSMADQCLFIAGKVICLIYMFRIPYFMLRAWIK